MKKVSKDTSKWSSSWRSPISLGIFILLVAAAIWLLANAQSIVTNL